MNDQQLPAPRINYPAAEYQKMAEDFIHNGRLEHTDIPDLIMWRKHLRDLRNIVTGSKTEKGHGRVLPDPNHGICKNLRLLCGNSRKGFQFAPGDKTYAPAHSADLIYAAAKVWPVYEELFAKGYVLSPLYPIPDFEDESMWEGKALRFRLSLISFTIKLLTTAINQLKGKTA